MKDKFRIGLLDFARSSYRTDVTEKLLTTKNASISTDTLSIIQWNGPLLGKNTFEKYTNQAF